MIWFQLGGKNQKEGAELPPITIERAILVAKDAFTSAAERDIYTGDAVKIQIITKDGIKEDSFPLRRD